MPYPETTDAFTVTDIKNWSTFKRQEVSASYPELRAFFR
jgi:hypothetical protein